MTCIVSPDVYKSKKALLEKIISGEGFTVVDPSIMNPRTFNILDLEPGEEVTVTNHPLRTKFCTIVHCDDGEWEI